MCTRFHVLRTRATRAVRCAKRATRAAHDFARSAGAKQRSGTCRRARAKRLSREIMRKSALAREESHALALCHAQCDSRHVRRLRGGERCSRIRTSKSVSRIFDAKHRKRLRLQPRRRSDCPSALPPPWASLASRRLDTGRRSSLNVLR